MHPACKFLDPNKAFLKDLDIQIFVKGELRHKITEMSQKSLTIICWELDTAEETFVCPEYCDECGKK